MNPFTAPQRRVMFGPDDGPLSMLNLRGDSCPKCCSEDTTEEERFADVDTGDAYAYYVCNSCGFLWGWAN